MLSGVISQEVLAARGTIVLRAYLDDESILSAFIARSGDQFISPNLTTDNDTVFSAGQTNGLIPAILLDGEIIFFPTVSEFDQILIPEIYFSADIFSLPDIRIPGALQTNLFVADDVIFGSVVLAPGTLRSGLWTDLDTFYVSTISVSDTLRPGLWSDPDAFYAQFLSVTVSSPIFASDDIIYQPGLISPIFLQPALWTDTDVIYASAAEYDQTLLPALFTDADSFFAPTIQIVIPSNLLLHCNGTNGSTSFPDSSSFTHTVTATGCVVDTSTFQFGTASAHFTAAAGNRLALDGSTDFAFGTGDFTVDFWVRAASLPGSNVILYDSRGSGNNGLYPTIYISSTNTLNYFQSSANRITGATTITTGTFHHIALTRSGTSTRLFLDGVQQGSTYTDSNNYINGTSRPSIGGYGGDNISAQTLNGWIDEVRVIKGTAVWTANFTPPTFPYAG